MTGRVYFGEVLIKGWLMSELLTTSECTKRVLKNTSEVHANSHKPMKELRNENERNMQTKKNDTREFIGCKTASRKLV